MILWPLYPQVLEKHLKLVDTGTSPYGLRLSSASPGEGETGRPLWNEFMYQKCYS